MNVRAHAQGGAAAAIATALAAWGLSAQETHEVGEALEACHATMERQQESFLALLREITLHPEPDPR